MKNDFPTTLKELQEELLLHSKVGRGGVGDAGFRLAIAIDNLGSFTRHYTHDQKENPTTRPHGTPASKTSDAGHAIVQILTYIAVCGIDLREATNIALAGLRECEFQKREAEDVAKIRGSVAQTGMVKSLVWKPQRFDGGLNFPANPENFIAVLSHATTDARLSKFAGIIMDHGGMNCHAAIIAREHRIPCIVGTGNAMKLLVDFDMVEMGRNGGVVTKIENAADVIRRNTK